MDNSNDGFDSLDAVAAPSYDDTVAATIGVQPMDDSDAGVEPEPDAGPQWIDAGNGVAYATLDVEGDGVLEAMVVDVNGDGVPDILIEKLDGGYRQSADVDQDGVFEDVQEFTDEEMAAYDPAIVDIMSGGGADTVEEPVAYPDVDEGMIVGDPFAYGDDWFTQSFDGSCLPAAVAQIYSEYTGTPVTDQGFVALVNELGLWHVDGSGTPGIAPADAETLLDSVGIPAEHLDGQTIEDLIAYLSEPPHAVMVAVDADTIWYGDEADGLDHVVLITGIDLEAGVVYLSDTGIDEGNMRAVDLDIFMESWSVSGNSLVVVEQSAEDYRAEMEYQEATTALVESAPREVEDAEPASVDSGAADSSSGGDLATASVGESFDPDIFDQDPGFGSFAPAPDPLAGVATWVSTHPWLIVPVTIGAAAVIRGIANSASRNDKQ